MKEAFLFFVLLGCLQAIQGAARGPVSNEDIRDAILQVVNYVRSVDDKLERHEYRERVLGEQLKKGMVNIDKRIKSFEPLKGSFGRLDERIAAIETILMQKDDRERIQLQKTFDTVEDIHKNLPIIVDKLKDDIIEKLSNDIPPAQITEPTVSRKAFEKMEKDIIDKIDKVSKAVNNMDKELNQIKIDNKNIRDINNKSYEHLDKVKRQLTSSEHLLEKYENKLSEYNNRIPEVPQANFKEQNEWTKNFLNALEDQKGKIHQLLEEVRNLEQRVHRLPNKTDLEVAHNTTLDKLEEIKYETGQQPAKSALLLDTKLRQISDDGNQKHDQITKAIGEMSEITESLTESISGSYEQIKNEMQALGKLEQVMMQTADSVLDTKRRMEYGVHQILAEVAKNIKESTKDINEGVNARFDLFQMSVLDEDNGALVNLTNKIGEEIDQVWRQIGIMHQQMSASADTLNKLQNQTDQYVNGSLNVMDSMKGKVGKITGRMSEVDENLNYLLGRLSLVTQQFNQLKSGLTTALDEIRGSFQAVQDKIKGPGPHKISSNEIEGPAVN